MKIFLPCRGEFGWIVMAHAPQVHAAIEPGDMVCCLPGLEAIYPGAASYFHVEPLHDREQAGMSLRDPGLAPLAQTLQSHHPDAQLIAPCPKAPRRYFLPAPTSVYGLACDVVVCPRRRGYGADKNWPHWQEATDRLIDRGLRVFAAGTKASSFDLRGVPRAWDYDRPLDATIEAMSSSHLVLATDSGLAHLAVMCGRPLLMISHGEGLVAPGLNDDGKPYWPIQMDRFAQENHLSSSITVLSHAWDDLQRVMDAAASALAKEST